MAHATAPKYQELKNMDDRGLKTKSIMNNLDDSENNAKISDSAYSNSCSNSQSRRSHSSKSTHSGSNSSGSSGYRGKPTVYNNNVGQPVDKRCNEKESKKKKKPVQVDNLAPEVQAEVECRPPLAPNNEAMKECIVEAQISSPVHTMSEKGPENMDISTSDVNSIIDEYATCSSPLLNNTVNYVTSRPASSCSIDGFSCVISMHDGVVVYTTSSLTTTLGFPNDMWFGRSFINFLHPLDRKTFASQITSGLAVPKTVYGMEEKALKPINTVSTMVCRIRRYRSLSSSLAVKEQVLTFFPFTLKFSFKNISDEEMEKLTYLIIQATPIFSAFKTPGQFISNPVAFMMRHSANGNMEYMGPESVPYLGYMPQDIINKGALQMYHPDDLVYLRQVYETIVKKGGVPRSKCYRMQVQNGDYLKLETEWSSFINPWSNKLEFVIGKHHIVQGPMNPDVFQAPDPDKALKRSEEEKNEAESLIDSIIRIMNDVLTKPAEVDKQHMNKRCHDLALFMERLIEEQPKTDDELRLDIQDVDHSCCERDSVMLGGISPHHENNDSKSSTDTPISYTQLNYNQTLQRYFESHGPYCSEDNTLECENTSDLKEQSALESISTTPIIPSCPCAMEIEETCKNDFISCVADYQHVPLTETLLTKHNADMEKNLIKIKRERTSFTKGEREKASNETRQKKIEHLARCNASFQPTLAGVTIESKLRGVKRPLETEPETHNSAQRHTRRRQSVSEAPVNGTATVTTSAANQWNNVNTVNSGNAFFVGIPQMSLMSPVAPMSGVFPMYYGPAPVQATAAGTDVCQPDATNSVQFQQPALPCMMYGQAMYGAPFVYSPINTQSYPMQQNMTPPSTMNATTTLNPVGLPNNKCTEDSKTASNRPEANPEIRDEFCRDNQNTEAVHDSKTAGPRNGQETTDRTDGGSSYSSFYSSFFFKTESCSADDSGEIMKVINKNNNRDCKDATSTYYQPPDTKKLARRKLEPPWMEQVCVTSELIYKYQVSTKTIEEVLAADRAKINTFEQSGLVNEQLSQLYLDLQLEGVTSKLTLEEGITSSSSSGEETTTKASKRSRRKREYSKLVMIYEENAPLPSPSNNELMAPEALS